MRGPAPDRYASPRGVSGSDSIAAFAGHTPVGVRRTRPLQALRAMGNDTKFKASWYHRIGFKFSVTLVLLSVCLVLCLSLMFFKFAEQLEEAEHQKRSLYIAQALSRQIVEPLLQDDRYALVQFLDSLVETDNKQTVHDRIVEYASVYNNQNILVVHVGETSGENEISNQITESILIPKDRDTFEVLSPVIDNQATVGILKLGVTRSHHLEEARTLRTKIWAVSVLLTVLGIFVSLLLTQHFLGPLLHVIRGAKMIGEGNWGTQIEVKSRDETGELVETFNDMSQKLQDAFDRVQRAQERLIRSERLNAIGRFSASLAHQLKNPLTSIKLGISSLGEPGADESFDAEEREMILNDVQRMEAIVNRFLSYGAPNKMVLSAVDINGLLKGLTDKLQPRFAAAHIQATLSLAEDLPSVFVDTDKMHEALENLCVNAIQAMPQGGEVRIQTSGNHCGEFVRIDVTDTGEGIEETVQEHLFEPFYTTRTNGSGLGLSIVHQIVQEHGGTISLRSARGKGTVFSIALPIQKVGLTNGQNLNRGR